MDNSYYLGLDMGTSSVGWAVTDNTYHIMRAKGKDLWGVREFEEAQTSVERRTNRVARRRRQREVARVGLLKLYFHDAIYEVDPNFFARLDNSKYHTEDKDEEVRYPNAIFNDKNYKDRDYFQQYPTIFHLRKELLENPEKHDVRLVYLAILNMFKHRGHFLNAGISAEDEGIKINEAYSAMSGAVSEVLSESLPMDVDFEKFTEILGSRDISKTKKSELICDLLKIDKKEKIKSELIKMICGRKVDAKGVFVELADEEKSVSIEFSAGYEDKEAEIIDALGEERYSVIDAAHKVYSIGVLSGILGNADYLSLARVESYEKHKADLVKLKSVYKRYATQSEYDTMFREMEPGTYSAYVSMVKIGGEKKRRNVKGRKPEDLYKKIKKDLEKWGKAYPDDGTIKEILDEIENESFLPKQLTADNGVIPNQVHARELKKILSNAEKYLPFLQEKDESGLTVSERITQLFSFQIPYYIGPVSENSQKNGGNGWVIRKESGRVLPWNFNEKIDVARTSEQFIKNLIRECTYLQGEKVLPKASLMYERFCVLNEINNIRVNGEKISVDLKQRIYKELFETGKKVTRNKLETWLKNNGIIKDGAELTGVDITINQSLTSYDKFLPIFGEKLKEDSCVEMVEDIISMSTIYGDAKKMLKTQLENKYGNVLSADEIKRILGFKFKDWGRLSKEFLCLQGEDRSSGEVMSLLRAMWETNYNMMELLYSEDFGFGASLEEKKHKSTTTLAEFTFEDLDDMYFSAPVKRMVWQTILIIKELSEVLGKAPERLFVEMTRNEDEKKQRSTPRKKKFLELYKSVKENQKYWNELIEKEDESGRLKSKKMYLYLTQMGKCMYTGEEIDLDRLFNDNIYDIDHIYPRHFTKDDNLDNNLVLVKKEWNSHKSDTFPLEESIYRSQKDNWKRLRSLNLISEEKYNRLMNRNPLSDEQKADFIARQLVETAQGTKGVTELLKQILEPLGTTIVYSKAVNVSDFRNERKIYKSRLVNDFHHAHDAYLNIVVGNVYYTKFTQNPRNFIAKEYSGGQTYNLGRMFEKDVVRNGYCAWKGSKAEEDAGTILIVRKMLSKQTPLLTRMNFEQHGKLADATLYSHLEVKDEGYLPIKSSDMKMRDISKYGGISSVAGAYFFLVEHEKKGKKVRTIESLPIIWAERVKQNPDKLLEYCISELKLTNPSIRLAKIKYQSLIKKDGYFMHLSKKTGNQLGLRNATSLLITNEWLGYFKKIESFVEKGELSNEVTKEMNDMFYMLLLSKFENTIFSKRPNPMFDKLSQARNRFNQLVVDKQCKVLFQIVNLFKIGVVYADLSPVDLAPKSGEILIGKDITKVSKIELVNQSVTGLFENSINLLTV